jgi:hypothetical protein
MAIFFYQLIFLQTKVGNNGRRHTLREKKQLKMSHLVICIGQLILPTLILSMEIILIPSSSSRYNTRGL